ncbi:PIN domain-containing protein [Patulibacter defluvii]|uniref:PIN domain-containing protein n=1 Tax=Patulibacter defluvii TaxID=3095358 RepID=UPI002A74B856|nr:PIN domain-containing protein [Patulibacter sp. DM4]
MSTAEPLYLADTSAWVKTRQRSTPSAVRERFATLVRAGRILICDVVALELLHHEDRPERFRQRRADLGVLARAATNDSATARAVEVMELLATRGGGAHRGPSTADYLVAAAAELAGATVLHYDRDYDAIAAVTGQPVAWLAPRGTI